MTSYPENEPRKEEEEETISSIIQSYPEKFNTILNKKEEFELIIDTIRISFEVLSKGLITVKHDVSNGYLFLQSKDESKNVGTLTLFKVETDYNMLFPIELNEEKIYNLKHFKSVVKEILNSKTTFSRVMNYINQAEKQIKGEKHE